MAERVADRTRQRGFRRDLRETLHQPRPQRREQRLRPGLADGNAFRRGEAADARLDGVNLTDPAQRFRGDRIRGLLVYVEELPPCMRQAKRQRDRSARTVRRGEVAVPRIGVDLQHAVEAPQVFLHVAPATVLGVAEHHRGLGRTLPGPVIHRIAPQPRDARSPAAAIEHRQRGVVAEHFRRRHHGRNQQPMQRLQPPHRPLDPAHESGAVEIDAVARQHLRLTIERQMPGELRDRDMGKQRRRRQPAVDRTWWRRRLHHRALAGAATISGPMAQPSPHFVAERVG